MKKIRLLSFVIIFNIIFSFFTVSYAETDVASALFNSDNALSSNMSVELVGKTKPVIETKDGITGWRLDASNPNLANIRVDIDDSVMYNLSQNDNVTVEVTYYDDNYGGFALYYDAKGDKPKSHFVQLKQENVWKVARFPLYDACFANRINTFDFYIMTNDAFEKTNEVCIMGESSGDILISSVKVIKEDTQSPFDISVKTGKTGNIFFEDEEIKFDINFSSKDYTAANAKYTVKDFKGNTVFTKSSPFASNRYNLKISNLKFGIYTLEISVDDGNILQSEIIDFSYSKKAQNPNKRLGTVIHYATAPYTKEDIRGITDLAKNAGYYFLRSGTDWATTEKEKGKYKISENYMYANKYADEIGLEILSILSCANPLYTPWPYRCDTEEARQGYYDFCYYMVDALKEYTDYFTSPNEYNFDTGNGGVHIPEKYENFVEMVKGSYPYIKAANPDAFIVSGAVGRYEKTYIQNCYDSGILDSCDAFSIHVYDYTGGPETWYIYPTLQWHNDQLKENDSTKQAWITENGWPSLPGDRKIATENGHNNEERTSFYYPRAFALNSNPDRIDTYINYSFIDNNTGYFYTEHNFGILEAHDYRTPFAAKPPYISTAAFNSILDGYEYKCDLNHESGSFADLSQINYNEKEYEYYSAEAKKFFKFYNDAHFAYVFENKNGEDITMFWKNEDAPEKNYTYTSDKPYLEIYDVYGNKTVIDNENGSYTAAYSNSPVYIRGIDKLNFGSIVLKDTVSAWDIDESELLNIGVKMPVNTKIGDSANVIVAAYNENKNLISVKQSDVKYFGGEISLQISAEGFGNAAYLKTFLFDGFSNLKPLFEANVVDSFGDDVNISYSSDGDYITLSGALKGREPYNNMIVTVWNENTTKTEFLNNYLDTVVYQDMIKTDANGIYEITFRIPENTDNLKVQLSGKDFVLQKKVYRIN